MPSTLLDLLVVHPLSRSGDIYRAYLADILAYLADILARIAGCDSELAYHAIVSNKTLANGDLVLPTQRLPLKRMKPVDQCADFAAKFPVDRRLFKMPIADGLHLPIFFAPTSLGRLILPYVF